VHNWATRSSSSSVFYVYVCFRTNGTPCYVGKGKGNRWKTTYKRTKNTYLRRIVERCGGSLPTVVIRSNLTEIEAFEIEMAFIRAIGRRDLGLGPLANRTDGGEGLSGHVFSAATRKILSDNITIRLAALDPKARAAAALRASRAVTDVKWITDGSTNRRISPASPVPTGWRIGRLHRTSKNFSLSTKSTRWINDGSNTRRLLPGDSLPRGWIYGRLPKRRKADSIRSHSASKLMPSSPTQTSSPARPVSTKAQ
jgi:hypothetical protein